MRVREIIIIAWQGEARQVDFILAIFVLTNCVGLKIYDEKHLTLRWPVILSSIRMEFKPEYDFNHSQILII